MSNWSDQNIGTDSKGFASPGAASRVETAWRACSTAFVQCSTRMRSSNRGLYQLATSPAATIPETLAAKVSSQRTPSSNSTPEPSSHDTTGSPRSRPRRAHTRPRCHRPAARLRRARFPRNSRPVRRTERERRAARALPRRMLPRRGPRLCASGVSKASIIVTSSPSCRAEAATSAPMKPAPITATRGFSASAARMPSESSRVRSV